MAQEPAPTLRRAYRLAFFVWGLGCIGPLPIYLAINAFLRRHLGTPNPIPILESAYLILIGLAALTAILVKPVSRYMLTKNLAKSVVAYPFAHLSRLETRLFGATGTISSMTHTTAVVGFMFAFLTGNPTPLYLGVLLSAALLLLFYPRYGQWEEWAAEIGEIQG